MACTAHRFVWSAMAASRPEVKHWSITCRPAPVETAHMPKAQRHEARCSAPPSMARMVLNSFCRRGNLSLGGNAGPTPATAAGAAIHAGADTRLRACERVGILVINLLAVKRLFSMYVKMLAFGSPGGARRQMCRPGRTDGPMHECEVCTPGIMHAAAAKTAGLPAPFLSYADRGSAAESTGSSRRWSIGYGSRALLWRDRWRRDYGIPGARAIVSNP